MDTAHRSVHRRLLTLALLGCATGAVLAVAAPPTRLSAAQQCKCDDSGTGNYACSADQTKCKAGTEICLLVCQ